MNVYLCGALKCNVCHVFIFSENWRGHPEVPDRGKVEYQYPETIDEWMTSKKLTRRTVRCPHSKQGEKQTKTYLQAVRYQAQEHGEVYTRRPTEMYHSASQ